MFSTGKNPLMKKLFHVEHLQVVYYIGRKAVKIQLLYLITFGFILLDMATGLIKAFKEKAYTSSIMREGLFHKCGSMLCIAFGVLLDYAQTFIDLGFTIPIAPTICGYIILMEIGSVTENISLINPQIVPNKLKSYLVKVAEKETKKGG